jgi:putative FmdB family regulatory protein
MPQYDYRCKSCDGYFSIERSMNDSAEPACTSCGSTDATRIWNIQFATTETRKGGAKPQAQAAPQGHMHRGGCCGGGACGT